MVKIIYIVVSITASLAFCFCENKEQEKNDGKKRIVSDFSDEPSTMTIDYSNPAKVVEVIFEVANSLEFEKLNNLCDPCGENNESSKAICELSDSEKEKFVNYFKNGHINGDIRIMNDTAWVPILFGTEGNKPDVIKLIERDNKWFIIDF
ncbi:MAG: hypothetical protein JXR58_05175 [Bacteroidales bacterium]|nr:hypothetical protein [Bacteroidales bacterium]